MSNEVEEQIRNYIHKYANKHHISFEEAKKHAICELVSSYYKD